MRGRAGTRGGKRVVLHVGAHKTGTTVVQQYLAARSDSLRRHGVRYVPRPVLTPLVGWGERLVREPAGFHALLDDFATARREHTLLISHENICGPPFVRGAAHLYAGAEPAVSALAELTARYRTTVVLTVRPVDELLESYYLQQVNMGGRLPFPRWLTDIDTTALSWRPLVELLRGHFDRVEVIDFDLIRSGAATFVGDVLRRGGIDFAVSPGDRQLTRRMNPGVSAQGLRLLLRGNDTVTDPVARARLRQFVQRHFHNGTGPRPELLDRATRDAVRARYAAEYAELTTEPTAA